MQTIAPASLASKLSDRRVAVLVFFVATFAVSWVWWGIVRLITPSPSTALILPGAWAPTIVAGVLTAQIEGRSGLRAWVKQVQQWRAAWYWYVFAILGPSLLALLALGINAALGGQNPELALITARFGMGPDQWSLVLALSPIIFLVTLVSGGPIAEELGWRGFAQPRLQEWVGANRAGAIIGVIWSLWHLPLFLVLPTATANVPLVWYIPLVSAWGVLFAWLYNRTRGSVLLCMLFHAGINFMLGALGLLTSPASPLLFGIFTMLTLIGAVIAWVRLNNKE